MGFTGVEVELIGMSLISVAIAVFYQKGRKSTSKLIQKLYPSNHSLREENEKLKLLLEQAQKEAKIGAWQWNLISNKITWSDEMYNIYELSKELGPGIDNVSELIIKEDLDGFNQSIQDTINGKIPKRIQYRIITKSGILKHISAKGEVFKDKNDEPIRIMGTAQDITQQTEAKGHLNQSKNHYQLLAKTLPVGIYRSDKAGRLIFVNQAMVNMFGYSSEEHMLKQHCSDFYKNKEDRHKMILDLEENKTLQDYSNTYCRIDGSNFIGTEFCQVHGDELHGVIQDTTEKSKVATEKNDLIHTLKNQTKDFETFAHIISHNLRIPLVNIVGLTEILDKDTLTRDNKEVINLIVQCTNNLDMIVKDLNKTISIREKQHEHYESILFCGLVDEVKSNLSIPITESGAYISCTCSDNLEIETIPKFLKNILYQLIDNAIKFRKVNQTPQVNITLHSDDKNYHITVQDNGIGIDLTINQDRLFKLYEKFYPEMEGRGVGLYMTYNHVNALKGQINVLSQVNTGTKVVITLPKGV
ncbi:MAG: ATP-binding protein [Reichenbachiella sp.]